MHFRGRLAAASCDQPGKAITAELVGARYEHEVSQIKDKLKTFRLLHQNVYLR
jgi:hypothetical protein